MPSDFYDPTVGGRNISGSTGGRGPFLGGLSSGDFGRLSDVNWSWNPGNIIDWPRDWRDEVNQSAPTSMTGIGGLPIDNARAGDQYLPGYDTTAGHGNTGSFSRESFRDWVLRSVLGVPRRGSRGLPGQQSPVPGIGGDIDISGDTSVSNGNNTPSPTGGFPWDSVINIGADLLSGLIGSKATKDAAETSLAGQQQALDLFSNLQDQALFLNMPGINTANVARARLASLLGLNVPGMSGGFGGSGQGGNFLSQLQTPGTEPVDDLMAYLEGTPGYKFQSQQGQKAILANARALGLGESGGTATQLGDFVAQGVAGPAFQSHINQLANLSGTGQTQQESINILSGGLNQANMLRGMAGTAAAGDIGSTEAWLNSVNSIGETLGEIDWGTVFPPKKTKTAVV